MKIFTSKTLQNYAKWASSPKVTKNINNYLPIVQSTYAVGCYATNVQKSKTMPQDKKNSMLTHDIICGGVGLFASAWLTKLTTRFKTNIIKELEKDKNLKNKVAVCNGVGIGIPIIVTTLVMRAGVPILASFLSPKIEKFRQALKEKKQDNFTNVINAEQKYK